MLHEGEIPASCSRKGAASLCCFRWGFRVAFSKSALREREGHPRLVADNNIKTERVPHACYQSRQPPRGMGVLLFRRPLSLRELEFRRPASAEPGPELGGVPRSPPRARPVRHTPLFPPSRVSPRRERLVSCCTGSSG